MRQTVIIVLLILSRSIFAGQILKGTLSGSLEPGSYEVTDVITVPAGKSLHIGPGTTMRFQNFTGIVVEGELTVRGSAESPVVFTSWNDGSGSTPAEPFDWNGIKVEREASGVVLEHVIIKYSTFGLGVESDGTPVQIRKVIFRHNGFSNLSRSQRTILAADGMPVNYIWPESMSTRSSETHLSRSTSDRREKPRKEKTARQERPADDSPTGREHGIWKPALRVGCATLAVSGAVMIVSGQIGFNRNQDLYLATENPQQLSIYKQRRDDAQVVYTLGIVAAALGSSGLVLTFVF